MFKAKLVTRKKCNEIEPLILTSLFFIFPPFSFFHFTVYKTVFIQNVDVMTTHGK